MILTETYKEDTTMDAFENSEYEYVPEEPEEAAPRSPRNSPIVPPVQGGKSLPTQTPLTKPTSLPGRNTAIIPRPNLP